MSILTSPPTNNDEKIKKRYQSVLAKVTTDIDTDFNIDEAIKNLYSYNDYSCNKPSFENMLTIYQKTIHMCTIMPISQNSGLELAKYYNKLLKFADKLIKSGRYDDIHDMDVICGKEYKLLLLSHYKNFIEKCDDTILINIVLYHVTHTQSYEYHKNLKEKISYFKEVNHVKLACIFEKILTSEEYKSRPLDRNHMTLYIMYIKLNVSIFDLKILNWDNKKLLELYECVVKNTNNDDCGFVEQFITNLLGIIDVKNCKNCCEIYFGLWCVNYRLSWLRNYNSDKFIKLVVGILKTEIAKSCKKYLNSLDNDDTILDVIKDSIIKNTNDHHMTVHSMINESLSEEDWNNVLLKVVIKYYIKYPSRDIYKFTQDYVYIKNDPNLEILFNLILNCSNDNIYRFADIIKKHRGNAYLEEKINHHFTVPLNLPIILKIFDSSRDSENNPMYDSDQYRAKSVILNSEYSYKSRSIAARILFRETNNVEYMEILNKLLIEEVNGNKKFYNTLLNMAISIKSDKQILTNTMFYLFLTYYDEKYEKQNIYLSNNSSNYDTIVTYLEKINISYIFTRFLEIMKLNKSVSFHILCLDIIGNIAENSLRSYKGEDIVSLHDSLRKVENVLESYYDLSIARKKLWDLGDCYKCCDLWTKIYLKYNPEEHQRISDEINHTLLEMDRNYFGNNYTTIMLNAQKIMRESKDKSSMIIYLLQVTRSDKILPWKFNVFFYELKNVYKKCNDDQKIYFKRWMAKYITEQNWIICQTELKNILSSFSSWYDAKIVDVGQLSELLNN